MNLESQGVRVFYGKGSSLGRGFALDGLIRPQSIVHVPSAIWRRVDSSSKIWKSVPWLERIIENEMAPPEIRFPSRLFSLHWGYWQSQDFFEGSSSTVRKQLESWLSLDTLPRLPTCGVHVRRGDYVTDAGAAATLGAQPLDYYKDAISRVGAQGIDKFVIYTDDREWAFRHLVGKDVELAPEGGSRDDFLGLSRSAAVIMSNSSFSWWAAFLASGRGNIPVVGPKNWFLDKAYDSTRLMRDDWERL